MTEEQIAKMWSESTQSIWPKKGEFTAGSTNQNLLDFAQSVLNIKQQELRERIAISQLAALTNVYKFGDYKSRSDKDMIILRSETAVEYADALIKELSKGKE